MPRGRKPGQVGVRSPRNQKPRGPADAAAREKFDTELAAKIGKEGFPDLRHQYIFSRHDVSTRALSLIWGVPVTTINSRIERARANSDDWISLREKHLEVLALGITHATEKAAATDTMSAIDTFKGLTGRCAMLAGTYLTTKPVPPIETILKVARVVDLTVDLWDRLTGANVAREVREARVAELGFIVDVVKQYVQDPEAVTAISHAITLRRALADRGASREFIDVVDTPRQVRAEAAAIDDAIDR